MLVSGCDYSDLFEALAQVNALFSNNIRFKYEPKSKGSGRVGLKWQCVLAVKDSGGDGGRRSPSGRRIAAACWHAYGAFFDSLPDGAVVSAMGTKIEPGQQWRDRDMFPYSDRVFMYSDACDCGSSWRPHCGPVSSW